MAVMIKVAAVLPRTLNHNSLYFVGSTWKTACDGLARNFQIKYVSFLGSSAQMDTKGARDISDGDGEGRLRCQSKLAVPAYRIQVVRIKQM